LGETPRGGAKPVAGWHSLLESAKLASQLDLFKAADIGLGPLENISDRAAGKTRWALRKILRPKSK
jgi:hypothetical protein